MIEFKNVTKKYKGSDTALKNVSLKIDDGEFVFVIGRSGAGKSTFAKVLIREERLTSGSIVVSVNKKQKDSGRVISSQYNLARISDRKVAKYRRNIGIIFQEFRLFPDKTVYENVAFAMRVIGESDANINHRIPWILELVGLKDKANRFPNELSGGQQQRVAIARAIANNPEIIIADEPTGNIDPQMSMDVMKLLLSLHKLGKTVIVITHENDIVDAVKRRVIALKDGEVVFDGEGGYNNALV